MIVKRLLNYAAIVLIVASFTLLPFLYGAKWGIEITTETSYNLGLEKGFIDGLTVGVDEGYNAGYIDGREVGHSAGASDAYKDSYNTFGEICSRSMVFSIDGKTYVCMLESNLDKNEFSTKVDL